MGEAITLADWYHALQNDIVPSKVHMEEGVPEDEVVVVYVYHQYLAKALWKDEKVRKRHIALMRLEVAQQAQEDLSYMPDGFVVVHRKVEDFTDVDFTTQLTLADVYGEKTRDLYIIGWKRLKKEGEST